MFLTSKIRKSANSKNHKHRQWSLAEFEPRLMLAGDAGTAVADTAASETTVEPAGAKVITEAQVSTDVELVFIDQSVTDLDQLLSGVDKSHEIVLLDANKDGIAQISETLNGRRGVSAVHLIAHGESGKIQLGNQVVDEATLVEQQNRIRLWGDALTDDADILLYSCDTAANAAGQQFISRLANLSGADVAASDNLTGSKLRGGDWVLERFVGNVEASLVINTSVQESYDGVMAITIYAAGQTNEETMELLIDGATVATFQNVGGDTSNGTFATYTYNVDGISADRIRVGFTNDLFNDPFDRNLVVDRINVDGVDYQTESSSVYSTGTWTSADGVTGGFGRGEVLNANGAFQFNADQNGTPIVIRARGTTGQESMSLQIDGQTVQTWNNIAQNYNNYVYTTGDTVTHNRVQVVFTNDLFDANSGTDRNLQVNFVTVNGVTVQTESANTYSTGTYTSELSPGFGRGDTLHTNGYLQFANPGNDGSQIAIYAQGFEGDENIELQIDGITVQQWNNIGTQQQAFVYNGQENISADRARVAFTNDQYIENVFDRNVLVDRIEIDNLQYQSESNSVFSTGTWQSSDGIVAGFGRGEILNGNGYFQYAPLSDNSAFSLASSVINVNESDGVAVLTINRTGDTSSAASIQYRTVSGSAVDGADFSGVDDVITFSPGQTSRDILIPLVNDNVSEGTETFSFTIDNPSGAGILVPRTATITINDVALPNYGDFSNTTGINFNGTAAQAGNALQLTNGGANQGGSAYYTTAIPVNNDSSFQSNFTFRVTGGTAGADGMAFVLQNSPAGSDALGGIGGNFGILGVQNSLAIEFDTYQNTWDVNDNHVSVVLNGNVASPIATKTYESDLNNGANKHAWVDYNGITNTLSVYVSDIDSKPTTPLIVTNVDLSLLVGNQVYAGFAAGTGGLVNTHEVLDWNMNTEVPPIPNNPNPGTTLATTTVASGFVVPTSIDFVADGSVMFIAEQGGRVLYLQNGVNQGELLDFSDRVNGTRDRGLLDIAVHPDLANNPYLYLLYTYDPPEVFANTGLAGPDGNGNRAGRLTRVTLDASTGYTSIIANSEVILLGENSTWQNFNGFANSTSNFAEPPAGILANGSNLQDFIASDSESHTVGSVEFGPDGALYVSIGDGTSYNQVDVRSLRVQDLDNLSGKILRVDPITGDGLSDNPFYISGQPDANRSKVYQYGVRNPFRISVDDATGQVYVGDVGWTTWEEVNAGAPGANFGWPFYEGSTGVNSPTNGYSGLPEAGAFYANNNATPSILSLNHAADGINAIVLGAVYQGDQYPEEFKGDLFFNDLGQGIVRNISFDSNGDIASVNTFTTGANIVVQMVEGPDGFLYFVDLDGGFVGRWEFV